jgi:hypothetical protein
MIGRELLVFTEHKPKNTKNIARANNNDTKFYNIQNVFDYKYFTDEMVGFRPQGIVFQFGIAPHTLLKRAQSYPFYDIHNSRHIVALKPREQSYSLQYEEIVIFWIIFINLQILKWN